MVNPASSSPLFLQYQGARLELSDRRMIKGKRYSMRIVLPAYLDISAPKVFMAGQNPLALPHNGLTVASEDVKIICPKDGALFKVETVGSSADLDGSFNIYNFLIRSLCSSSCKHLNSQVFLAVELPLIGLVFYPKPIVLMAKESRKPVSESAASSTTVAEGMIEEPPQQIISPSAIAPSTSVSEPLGFISSSSVGVQRSIASAPASLDPSPESGDHLPDGGSLNLSSSDPFHVSPAHLEPPSYPSVIRTFHCSCPINGQCQLSNEAVRDSIILFYNKEMSGAVVSHVVSLPQNDGVFITSSKYRTISDAESSHAVFWSWVSYMESQGTKLLPLGCYCSWY